jgi:hypothetical protein
LFILINPGPIRCPVQVVPNVLSFDLDDPGASDLVHIDPLIKVWVDGTVFPGQAGDVGCDVDGASVGARSVGREGDEGDAVGRGEKVVAVGCRDIRFTISYVAIKYRITISDSLQ